MSPEQVPRRRAARDESTRAVSRSAYEGLFRDHYSGLVKLASLLVDDRGAAEEVVQEAFMRRFRARGRPVITETQVRAALHEAAAAVEVDEDLAWQRAWIEVARQPIRRVRRASIALAAAAVVVVAVLAWQLFTQNDTSPSVHSV